ncbi:MAG: DUF3135 domain-containing protein [Candidatus Reddybacter sp.]
MLKKLPEFGELVLLAKNNPGALEVLRKEYSKDIIDNAPENFKRRLRGLQFQINMEVKKNPNPIVSCRIISQMMLQSFGELSNVLEDFAGKRALLYQPQRENKAVAAETTSSAIIISFPT